MPLMENRRPDSGSSPGRRWGLAATAAWSHRWGVLGWIAGAGGFLMYFGVAYQASVGSYPGGPAAFGLAAAPVAEAMRPLTGVAERLDTYGGYVTYHNASIAAFVLSLWAVIQGARAIRGWEERGALGVWLATGTRRWRLVVDQATGMMLALIAIAMGVGGGLGIGAAAAGDPSWGASFVVAMEMALVAATFFAMATFVSQLTTTARAGAGLTTIMLVATYLAANMSSELGWFGWVRFVSPFFYFQQSRLLIPGHAFDPVATAIVAVAAVAIAGAAAVAFERRDVGASLLPMPTASPPLDAPTTVRLKSFWNRDFWLADLRGQWIALTLWVLGSAGTMFLIVYSAKQVFQIWESSDFIRQLFVRVPGSTITDQYMTYVTIVAGLAPAGFVVAEAARWVGDLVDGRAETVLAASGSRLRVVLEWAMSMTVGVVLVVAGVIGGALAGAQAGGIELRIESLVRTGADAVLLGLGIGGVALLAVVVFRNGAAIGALGAGLGLGFFVSILAPMLNWPDWVVRLSPFEAFGTPYSAVPRPSGIALLAGLALIGGLGAAAVARRRSSFT